MPRSGAGTLACSVFVVLLVEVSGKYGCFSVNQSGGMGGCVHDST